MKDLLDAGQVLGRSEMKKIMAGSGSGGGTGCYICIGGIHCYQVDTGERGRDLCSNKGYPNYGCDTTNSIACVG